MSRIEKAARLAEVVDGDDVRMVERRERLRLAGEALGELRHPSPAPARGASARRAG